MVNVPQLDYELQGRLISLWSGSWIRRARALSCQSKICYTTWGTFYTQHSPAAAQHPFWLLGPSRTYVEHRLKYYSYETAKEHQPEAITPSKFDIILTVLCFHLTGPTWTTRTMMMPPLGIANHLNHHHHPSTGGSADALATIVGRVVLLYDVHPGHGLPVWRHWGHQHRRHRFLAAFAKAQMARKCLCLCWCLLWSRHWPGQAGEYLESRMKVRAQFGQLFWNFDEDGMKGSDCSFFVAGGRMLSQLWLKKAKMM